MSDIRDSSASGVPYFLKLLKETVDLSKNLYDMTTYEGRASHFYRSVNPLNLFKDHVSARDVVRKGIVSSFYRGSRVNLSQLQGELRFCCGKTEKVQADGGTIPPGMSREDVWNAKYIYDSAYHPTTGELVFMPGRMSFQGKNFNYCHPYSYIHFCTLSPINGHFCRFFKMNSFFFSTRKLYNRLWHDYILQNSTSKYSWSIGQSKFQFNC